MARLSGVELPNNKRVEIALTSIFGVGRTLGRKLCEHAGVDPATKAKDLTDEQVNALRRSIEETETKVEGDLRTEIIMNIKRLKDIKCYRGMRHIKRLPCRGQRSRTNNRTVRGGSKKTVANKKKVGKK